MGSAADLGHPEARAELIETGEALAVALANAMLASYRSNHGHRLSGRKGRA